ncbi:MAG TPA: hypothetical protein VGP48_08510 [Stellaceae bacterium]|jgi:hypothetical protein|nr:hypothetical protein [Stellaceae bacterium]
MLDEIETDEWRARVAEVDSRRVALSEVGRWFTPWILGGVLIVVCLGGLWCASAASDDGTYAVGLAASALALAALMWQLRIALEGQTLDLSGRLLVDDQDSLVILIALLGAMAVGGLILAARGDSPATGGTGYGLCLFAIALIFANLKHYFDRRERS